MSQIGTIKVEDAKRLGKQLRARGLIVVAFDDNNYATASYGKHKRDCADMASLADGVTDAIENAIFTVWTKRNARGKVVDAPKRPCVIGQFCSDHGFIHGGEAEHLRERVERFMETLSDEEQHIRSALQRIVDDVDARDSLAYREATDDEEKMPEGIAALRTVLKRKRWDDQGGYLGYRDGKWDGESGLRAAPDELNALFALAGIEPDEIVSKGSCADCKHAVNGRERGYTPPCLSCKRPRMSNFEPKE